MNTNKLDQTHSNDICNSTYPSNFKATIYNKDNLVIVTWNSVCDVASYCLEINGSEINDVVCPYIFKCNPNTVYNMRMKFVCPNISSTWSDMISISSSQDTQHKKTDKILIGYWQNISTELSPIKISDVSLDFDLIHVAFATSKDYATLEFVPNGESEAEFISGIKYLQSKNKKVCISIGGSDEIIILRTQEDEDKFVESLINIIKTYGFNGLDIQIESGIILTKGDNDFKNPITPTIVHLINGIRRIVSAFNKDFILSMTPEVVYLQGGYSAYESIWGAYLPIIYALNDKLNILSVKNYSSGSILALDDRIYTQETLDFPVAMCEMLLQGFPIAGNDENIFPPIEENKLCIGVLASPSNEQKENKYPIAAEITLNYLILGESFGGNYILNNENGYKNFKGVMVWSINRDQPDDYAFSKSYRKYLDSLDNLN